MSSEQSQDPPHDLDSESSIDSPFLPGEEHEIETLPVEGSNLTSRIEPSPVRVCAWPYVVDGKQTTKDSPPSASVLDSPGSARRRGKYFSSRTAKDVMAHRDLKRDIVSSKNNEIDSPSSSCENLPGSDSSVTVNIIVSADPVVSTGTTGEETTAIKVPSLSDTTDR